MSTYALKYNDHNTNIADGLKSMLACAEMTDITLAVEGRTFKAHQLVLAMFSPYFRELFNSSTTTKHTILFMKNVRHRIMKDLLIFMYEGSVEIPKDDLDLFIETARELQIKGLSAEAVHRSENSTDSLKRAISSEGATQDNNAKRSKSLEAPATQAAPGMFGLPYTTPSTSWMPNSTASHNLPYIVNVGQSMAAVKAEVEASPASEQEEDVVYVENSTSIDEAYNDDDDEDLLSQIKVEQVTFAQLSGDKMANSSEGVPVNVSLYKSAGTERVKGVIWDGFRYCLSKHRRKWSTWRCTQESNHKCRARVVITDDDRIVLTNQHNHRRSQLNRDDCAHVRMTYRWIAYSQWLLENKYYAARGRKDT